MIKYGNSGIADVKFGSQHVEKVYNGTYLVWERDKLYTFPNANAKLASNTSLGFRCNQTQVNGVHLAWKAFDNSLDTAFCGLNNSQDRIFIAFPFPIVIKSITISDKGQGYSTQGGIKTGEILVNENVKTKYSDTGWVSWCELNRSGVISNNTDVTSTVHKNVSYVTPVRSIYIWGKTWGNGGTSGHIITEVSIRYTADPADVSAWKAEYNIP